MQFDKLIDDLLCLQTRYPELIWRLRDKAGEIEIEFFLEELALDCTAELQKFTSADTNPAECEFAAVSSPERPRVVCLVFPAGLSSKTRGTVTEILKSFLEEHHSSHL